MAQQTLEKRRYPRIDTSAESRFKIRIFSPKGKQIDECQVVNLSLGGVAFYSFSNIVVGTLYTLRTRVEIVLPNGARVPARAALRRVKPEVCGDTCLCVFELREISNKSTHVLSNHIPF
jgi:hypothetical protein